MREESCSNLIWLCVQFWREEGREGSLLDIENCTAAKISLNSPPLRLLLSAVRQIEGQIIIDCWHTVYYCGKRCDAVAAAASGNLR